MTKGDFERLREGDIVTKKMFPSGKVIKGEVVHIDQGREFIVMRHYGDNSYNRIDTAGSYKDFDIHKGTFA